MALDSLHGSSVGLTWSKCGTGYRELPRSMLKAMASIHTANCRRPLRGEGVLEIDGQKQSTVPE